MTGSSEPRPDAVLALSYAFPPMALPEAALAAKTMAFLPGFEVDVIAAQADRERTGDDRSLLDHVASGFRDVVRLDTPSKLRQRAFEKLPFLKNAPDVLRALNARALRQVMDRGLGRYAALLTWSQWHSVHLVGAALKRRYPNIPWLAHLSDPWVDNPFVRLSPLEARLNRRLEGDVVSRADLLLFTSQLTLDLVVGKYPPAIRQKARVIPHPYDPELYPDTSAKDRDGQTIVRYLGNFYGHRTPRPLFAALRGLAAHRPETLEGLRIELIGSVDDEAMFAGCEDGLPGDLVVRRPAVDYRTSLRLMTEADGLLLIDAPAQQSVFLPSKLVDYIGAGRPVLGLTPPGTSADLIERLGGSSADPTDPAAVAAALDAFLSGLPKATPAEPWGPDAIRQAYCADRVRRSMADAISEAIGRARGGRTACAAE